MTLRVTFLGTSAAIPTNARNPSGIFINADGDQLLFDAGEGTQRQMMRYGTGFGVSAIFVTHLHGDHVLGLPGLLQTWAFTDRDEPLFIYVPTGTGGRLRQFLFSLEGEPSYGVEIIEVSAGDVAFRGDHYDIHVFTTSHDTRSVGYALIENDRKGRFDREKAESLGVPVGPLFSRLHSGESVELDDGTLVRPEEVVGPPRPGRKLIYTGDTRKSTAVSTVASNADVLIHDATFASDHRKRAKKTAHTTAREAALVATEAAVRHLVLTHISSRYAADATDHRDEASAVFDGDVTVARDGLELEIPFVNKN